MSHEVTDFAGAFDEEAAVAGQREFGRREAMRLFLYGVAGSAALAAAGCSRGGGSPQEPNPTGAPSSPEQDHQEEFLLQAGESLINLHEESHGGWRFRSEIQAPHYQTDRDVGAASVGMGFLAMAEKYPDDPKWINAAKHTASWLLAVSSQDGHGGLYWHDYIDDDSTSPDIYTSFDDGAIGIGDFFWQLYEKTGESSYHDIALGALRWTFSQAEDDGQGGFRWRWNVGDNSSPYYMGMGEGVVGLVHSFATFYDRFKKENQLELAGTCKRYIDGTVSYIQSVQGAVGRELGANAPITTIPETGVIGHDGDTNRNSGYLSGAAGEAMMYLKLHQAFGGGQYLAKAGEALGWLSDTNEGPMVDFGDGTVAWRLALDPEGRNDNHYATGIEEGSAGIGWTYLQAYGQTGEKSYLKIAQEAADWLLKVAVRDERGGLSWYEDMHPKNPLIHANLNNGAAGIGLFFQDLYLATGNSRYQLAAQGALNWIMNSSEPNGKNIGWSDNGGNDPYSNDPSWHWGIAGIIEFVQRVVGGKMDIPGEQPALTSRLLYRS
jgi:rhamnogalacturonyl hydrolase YesR